VPFAPYADNRDLGGFILIDRFTNNTVGLGLIHFALRRASNIHWQALDVDRHTRGLDRRARSRPVLWFTGLSGSGKSTVANIVEKRLTAMGTAHLPARRRQCPPRPEPRPRLHRCRPGGEHPPRRRGARLMADAGLITLVSFISPFRSERRMARDMLEDGEFVEVHVDTPLEVCRGTRRERPLCQGPRRRDQELHRHRFG
jgi:bifunctional enzyme CysN/CysC